MMTEDRWTDENGNYLAVEASPRLFSEDDWHEYDLRAEELARNPVRQYRTPLHPSTDAWADLHWLFRMYGLRRPIFADDSGLGLDWAEEEMFQMRKRQMQQLPKWRGKKEGRTKRHRRRERNRKADEEYYRKYGFLDSKKCPKFGLEAHLDEGYDEHVFKTVLPMSWRVHYWLRAYLDDGRDHKMGIVDKSKEVFWPAVNKSKRELDDSFVLWMPGRLQSESMSQLDRVGTDAVMRTQMAAHALRRSQSLTTLDAEETHEFNPMSPEAQQALEAEHDLYIRLVESERQDFFDWNDVCFYYTF